MPDTLKYVPIVLLVMTLFRAMQRDKERQHARRSQKEKNSCVNTNNPARGGEHRQANGSPAKNQRVHIVRPLVRVDRL